MRHRIKARLTQVNQEKIYSVSYPNKMYEIHYSRYNSESLPRVYETMVVGLSESQMHVLIERSEYKSIEAHVFGWGNKREDLSPREIIKEDYTSGMIKALSKVLSANRRAKELWDFAVSKRKRAES